MRVYLQPPQPSRGLDRIATALRRYAPASIEVLSFPRNADLTVIYAIGRRDAIERQVNDILERDKQYAIIQVCLRSTMSPSTADWAYPIWTFAKCIWSYYDLKAAVAADGEDRNWELGYPATFYHAPLGVDSSVFYPRYDNGEFIIGTCGLSRLQESVRECHLAAKQVGQQSFHLGPNQWNGDHVTFAKGIIDQQVANYWSSCAFVSGLRRKEGFELPAAEGLLCGARPVCFDSPDWRFNYKGWAEYIEETDRQGVVDQLVQLFRQGARPVTAHEREEAAHWFNWERVCGEFWGRCL